VLHCRARGFFQAGPITKRKRRSSSCRKTRISLREFGAAESTLRDGKWA
jgi:hypothetical protein